MNLKQKLRKIDEKVYKQKIFKPYLSRIRGFTRVQVLVDRLLYSRKININGVEIYLNDVDEAKEHLRWNSAEGYLKRRDIKKGDLVLDAGCFPGEFAIYAAKKGAKVIAVEPDKTNREKMQKNFERNNVADQIEVERRVLWGDNNGVSFKSDGYTSKTTGNEGNTPSVTLEQLVDENDCFDFIKMDVEGAEIEILENFTDESCHSFCAIASYHEIDGEKTSEKLEEILSDSETGFQAHLTTWGRL